jgi:hypothetical protein
MRKHGTTGVLTWAFPSIAAVFVFASTAAVADTVTVVNTPRNPVPVTVTGGTVNIGSLPPITATVPSNLTIANPATAPVFTSSTSDPARAPFFATIPIACQVTTFSGYATNVAGNTCSSTLILAPSAGQRFVIQQVAGQYYGTGPLTVGELQVNAADYSTTPTKPLGFMNQNVTYTSVNLSLVESTFSVSFPPFVFDATDTSSLLITVNNPGPTDAGVFGDSLILVVSGYVLDCSHVPCAPIRGK